MDNHWSDLTKVLSIVLDCPLCKLVVGAAKWRTNICPMGVEK
jgi:choline transport protein